MRRPDFSSAPDNVGPLLVTVTNARFLLDFPDGAEKLFSADLQLTRVGSFSHVFQEVLFAEGESAAIIYGVEFEDGYPKGLARDLALKQQKLVAFLRSQNTENDRLLGPMAKIFSSRAYSSELLVTRAYIAERDSQLEPGVGYFDDVKNEYVLLLVGAY